MAIVVDRSEQVSGGEIVDDYYIAQTFVAGGKALEELAFSSTTLAPIRPATGSW